MMNTELVNNSAQVMDSPTTESKTTKSFYQNLQDYHNSKIHTVKIKCKARKNQFYNTAHTEQHFIINHICILDQMREELLILKQANKDKYLHNLIENSLLSINHEKNSFL